MRRKIILTIFLSVIVARVFAQWECPSQLGSTLKSFGKSKLYWGSEITAGVGYITNNSILNSMGILGLDRSGKNWTVYLEGGYKYWNRYDIDQKVDYSNFHFGIREFLFQYRSKLNKLTLGIQSARLDDDYLLNERIVGINYKLSKGPWALNFSGGTVTKDFARNGTFCAVSYMYDIIPDREPSVLGNVPGQTNLIAATLKFTPSKMKKDEFAASNSDKNGKFAIESAGLVLYDEFGTWIEKNVLIGGLFANIVIPANISFKPEVLYQSSLGNNAIIYSLKFEKSFTGKNLRSNFNIRYIGVSAIDNNAKAINSFSNIFAGDVLRLDAIDLPLLLAGAKFSIPSIRTHIKIQYAGQIKSDPMSEFDIEFGKRFGKHLQINGIGGIVNSSLLLKTTVLSRIEIRFFF